MKLQQIDDLNGKVEDVNKRILMLRAKFKRDINYTNYENLNKRFNPELTAYIALSILKEEIPWIYDYGNNIIKDIKNEKNYDIIYRKIDELESILKESIYVGKNYTQRTIGEIRFYRELDIEEVIYRLIKSLTEFMKLH